MTVSFRISAAWARRDRLLAMLVRVLEQATDVAGGEVDSQGPGGVGVAEHVGEVGAALHQHTLEVIRRLTWRAMPRPDNSAPIVNMS